ncbi:hypothetical protein [Sphaerochaeta sp. S2]|uniref:hypothetical protein n=1 Tax=Sphaerochaeta sp. S2 TaxID=2798868 RepID=UPI0018E9ED8D|nr:hypothetical protein [Sphaerochaeta sp. S2]MBJ2357315.1 hypothetical protein [Sphaerochaeta sp. S2]
MSESITISKNVVSKLALLLAYGESNSTSSIEETDTHWVLAASNEKGSGPSNQFFRLCMEKEVQLALEESMAPLREILYRKAFEPISKGN